MMETRSRRGIFIIVSIAIAVLFIIISGRYLFLHNKSYKNQAIERGDAIYLNEIKYSPISSPDLNEYTISNVLICKTDTGSPYRAGTRGRLLPRTAHHGTRCRRR